VGTVVGAAAGAVIGTATGNPGAGAAIGAGSGLVLGSASGVQASAASGAALQSRYDMAYLQCMYAKGNQVPGVPLPECPVLPCRHRPQGSRRHRPQGLSSGRDRDPTAQRSTTDSVWERSRGQPALQQECGAGCLSLLLVSTAGGLPWSPP